METNSNLQPAERIKSLAQQLGLTEDMPSTGKLEFDNTFNVIDFNNKNLVNPRSKFNVKTVKYSDFIRRINKDEFFDAEIIEKQISEDPIKIRIDQDKEF